MSRAEWVRATAQWIHEEAERLSSDNLEAANALLRVHYRVLALLDAPEAEPVDAASAASAHLCDTAAQPTNEQIVCSVVERWLLSTDHIDAAADLIGQIHAAKSRLRREGDSA